MSHYEWLLKIDWKKTSWSRRCFFHATTFALHITCNEWVTSTFWHHIFCHCLNLFEALLLQSPFCRIKTYFVCTKPHITSLDIFLTLLALLILSPSYQITTQRRQWDLFSNFQLLWWMLLVWDHMFVYVASAMTLKIVEDCFLSRIDLHHVKSSVVAQSIISSEDSWVDPSTNATQLTEKYKQQLGADKFILSYSFTKWWWSKINKEAFGQEKK